MANTGDSQMVRPPVERVVERAVIVVRVVAPSHSKYSASTWATARMNVLDGVPTDRVPPGTQAASSQHAAHPWRTLPRCVRHAGAGRRADRTGTGRSTPGRVDEVPQRPGLTTAAPTNHRSPAIGRCCTRRATPSWRRAAATRGGPGPGGGSLGQLRCTCRAATQNASPQSARPASVGSRGDSYGGSNHRAGQDPTRSIRKARGADSTLSSSPR